MRVEVEDHDGSVDLFGGVVGRNGQAVDSAIAGAGGPPGVV